MRDRTTNDRRPPDAFLREPATDYVRPVLHDLAERIEAASLGLPRAFVDALSARYAVDGPVAQGGMATVYRGYDGALARSVAIKVLKPALADALSVDRFTREIEITAKLQHARIVPIYDRGEAGGLLYYVMRLFEGGSLRQHVDRHGPLTIRETIEIARDVARALDFAHERGIVHRDIKPENILLEAGNAFIADFGVARIIDAAERRQLTQTGVAIGTPLYMSPEQADSGRVVDRRTDVYSLGCVVYEMLAGEPPFTGPGHRGVIAKHAAASVPDLRVLRPTISDSLQGVIAKALSKTPADRYPAAGDFIEALDRAHGEESAPPEPIGRRSVTGWLPPRWRRRSAIIAAIAAAVVIGLAIRPLAHRVVAAARTGSAPDTIRIAIMPFRYEANVGGDLNEQQLLTDALRRWQRFAVTDPRRFAVADPTAVRAAVRTAAQPLDKRRIAATLNAGRVIEGSISLVNDSLRIYAALYDAQSDRSVRDATARLPILVKGLDSAMADVADQLMFGILDSAARAGCRKTTVVSAYLACASAYSSVFDWNLGPADRAFTVADEADPHYTQVQLWLALIRHWRLEPAQRWKSFAERAATSRAALGPRDQIRLDALLALSRGEFERACATFRGLTDAAPEDFTAWYSLGACMRADDIVVPDRTSRWRWRFRTSHGAALSAYKRAFELRPQILAAFKDDFFQNIRTLFVPTRNVARAGRLKAGGPPIFLGRPTMIADTLAIIPFPAAWVRESRPETLLPRMDDAARHQRRLFYDIAVSWVATNPTRNASAALNALAIAMELLGDASAARDTLKSARARARGFDPIEEQRIAIQEVFLGLKIALPDNERVLSETKALADSLLRTPAPEAGANALLLAALAAVTGRAGQAADYARHAPVRLASTTSDMRREAGALLAFASLGGPLDSLRALSPRVSGLIKTLRDDEQLGARDELIARAGTLAYSPAWRPLPSDSTGDPLFDAQRTLLSGDRTKALAYLAIRQRVRKSIAPADFVFDGVYPEAAMLVELGDVPGAIAWLDPVLDAVPFMPPMSLADIAGAGCLVRSMVLRAEVATRRGDQATASRWAKAAALLWRDADLFLQPTVRRMRALAN